MKYYVVSNGYVISATLRKGKWTAFRTYVRSYATSLSHKHALAYAYIGMNCKVIDESAFKDYKLKGE